MHGDEVDKAFQNATERLSRINLEKSELMERLSFLEAELQIVLRFLDDWHHFASIQNTQKAGSTDSAKGEFEGLKRRTATKSTRPQNPDKSVVGDSVAELLEEAGRPLSRNKIMSELEKHNIFLQGTDPKMVLSTMLWRMKDRFQRIPGQGYWFADRQIPVQFTGSFEDEFAAP